MPKVKTSRSATLRLDRARAARIATQGLPPGPKPALVPTLERTGFVRTLGGVDAYLAFRARVPSVTRAEVDRAIQQAKIQVVPSVRGCMYVVPRRDVPLALRAAQLLSKTRDERDQAKAGVKKGETEKTAKAALATLQSKGPLTTDALRKAMPDGSVRSLGEQGKKVGVSSTLPGALRMLEFEGKIDRTPSEGRLDNERYLWRAVEQSPFAGAKLPNDPIDLWARLAEIFLGTAGLASVKDFAAWTGIPQRDATAAMERVPTSEVVVDGWGDPQRVLDSQLDAVLESPANDAVALLPFEDNVLALGGKAAAMVDPKLHALMVPSWGSYKPMKLGDAKHMAFRSVVAEGRVVGFWEYDPDKGAVVFALFDELKVATRKRIQDEADGVASFLRQELGHAKSFSLDTDDELRNRSAALRKLPTAARR